MSNNKLPLFCRIFGHKFIAHIQMGFMSEYAQTLDNPMCKRCGLIIQE